MENVSNWVTIGLVVHCWYVILCFGHVFSTIYFIFRYLDHLLLLVLFMCFIFHMNLICLLFCTESRNSNNAIRQLSRSFEELESLAKHVESILVHVDRTPCIIGILECIVGFKFILYFGVMLLDLTLTCI